MVAGHVQRIPTLISWCVEMVTKVTNVNKVSASSTIFTKNAQNQNAI